MKISGLQKLTLLDYPGKMAAIIFLGGCNFRCPFCHNSALVIGGDDSEIKENELFEFLEKRRKVLDGVVISGGEPLMSDKTLDLIKRIKEFGYDIKLDTNGSFPERLDEAIKSGAVDYVAMDIKNSKDKYAITIGKNDFDISKVEKSVELLKSSNILYEFRTTVVNEFHEEDDFHKIGKWIEGADKYFLQIYRDSDGVMTQGLTPPSIEKIEKFKEISRLYVKNTEIRGV